MCWRPTNEGALFAAIQAEHRSGVIARGCARSYGDACLNDGGDVIDTRGLTEVTRFDADTGDLECGAGLTIHDLLHRFLPLGFAPAMCPGTAFVTLGGLIANDVHGKNHHRVGSAGDIVTEFDLIVPSGELIRVSRASQRELFAATVGGIGLTGIISRVRMRLRRIPSNAMRVEEHRVRGLDEFMDALSAAETTHEHSVGWIDTLARGRSLGRGILELGDPAPEPVRRRGLPTLRLPMDLPGWVLSRRSVGAFNAWYYRRVPRRGRTRNVHVERFLFPLDSLRGWNRLYGRRGVYQFQCVVPHSDARRALHRLMDAATASGSASFLAVIKTLSRQGRGLLSFPMPGFTLAMDFPRRPDTTRLIHQLHDIVIAHGGRVYLAKDALLTPERFRAMYPGGAEFVSLLRRIDPRCTMRSDMARRLGLMPGPTT
jgi:decaprenylphospho-beta-D-ribofuranose 2-oxidase